MTISNSIPRFYNPAVDFDILQQFTNFYDIFQHFSTFSDIFWHFSTKFSNKIHIKCRFQLLGGLVYNMSGYFYNGKLKIFFQSERPKKAQINS